MPVTWFAHQAPVLPLKMARPTWFDATALCVGSMMPDLMYSFSAYAHIDTHELSTAIAYGVPLTVVVSTIIRFVVAPVAAHQIPDLGTFRLHSYAVLSRRRPRLLVSIVSASIGVVSHIELDAFTHTGRWGARWLGYDDIWVILGRFRHPLTSVLQYIGHVVGTLVAVLLLWAIGHRRLLDEWYGHGEVEQARDRTFGRTQFLTFWLFAAAGAVAGLAWGASDYLDFIQRVAVATFGGVVAGSLILGRRRAEPPAVDLYRDRGGRVHS